MQAAYYVDIVVITLLHNTVGSVKCRYLGHYFAAQYCRQRSIQISWSLLCCKILQSNVLCRYLCYYFAEQYCRQSTIQKSLVIILRCSNTVGSVLCIYLVHYSAAQYCRQRSMYVLSLSLLCCNILQTAYYVDILVITLLYNNVGSVQCRYFGYYFAAQYCRQRSMQIFWSLLCCTILYAVYYVNRYLGPYFAAQYFRQCTMQISWSFLCCTTLQAAYYVDILVITLLHYIVDSILCIYLGHQFAAQ